MLTLILRFSEYYEENFNFPHKHVLIFHVSVFCSMSVIHRSLPYLQLCSWLCVGNIYHFSNNSVHYVPHKSVQKVCLMLWISQLASSAHVCGIVSGGSTRMEPMVLVTSGWCLILRILILLLFLIHHHSFSHTSKLQGVLFAGAPC